MFCKYCGKVCEDNSTYCTGCGKSLHDSDVIGKTGGKKTYLDHKRKSLKRGIIALAILFVFILVSILLGGCSDATLSNIAESADVAEYSNNAGDKLPIVVNNFSIS